MSRTAFKRHQRVRKGFELNEKRSVGLQIYD